MITLPNIPYRIKIDAEDLPLLLRYKWHLSNKYLATKQINGGTVYLHRLILGAKKGEKVEFINGDVYDLRRENLRINNHIRWKKIPNAQKGLRKIGNNVYKYVWENGKHVYKGKLPF